MRSYTGTDSLISEMFYPSARNATPAIFGAFGTGDEE